MRLDILTNNLDFVTPHVSWFRHAPLSETWASEISIGMKVNILCSRTFYCVSTNQAYSIKFRWRWRTRILDKEMELQNLIG